MSQQHQLQWIRLLDFAFDIDSQKKGEEKKQTKDLNNLISAQDILAQGCFVALTDVSIIDLKGPQQYQ